MRSLTALLVMFCTVHYVAAGAPLNEELTTLLAGHKANVNAENKTGQSPLDICRSSDGESAFRKLGAQKGRGR